MRAFLTMVVAAGVLIGTAACSAGSAVWLPAPAGTTAPASEGSTSRPARPVPAFAHVVIVVEENHGAGQVLGLPYLAELRKTGAAFPQSHGVAHPSEPNYLALWSGSTQGLHSDACPIDLGSTPSLGSELLDSGRTVAGYAQGLPAAGSTVCSAGAYARRHNPLADFTATSGAAHNLPFSAFPSDYSTLPSVSLVVPDVDHDAHNGSLATADDWLRSNLGGYATWAATHDSLLIVTFDEDEGTDPNTILTVFSGAHVRPGTYQERIDHLNVLRTVEDAFGLAPLGSTAAPITDVWK